MCSTAKSRAASKGLEFSISIKDIEKLITDQDNKCALTGVELNWKWEKMGRRICPPDRASLDRIDSTKGYVPGNIQLVTDIVNRCKNAYSQPEFLEMCRRVSEYNP